MELTNGIIYFKTPDLEDKENVEEFKQEFENLNAKMYGTGGFGKENSYENWLEKIKLKNLSLNFVPATHIKK